MASKTKAVEFSIGSTVHRNMLIEPDVGEGRSTVVVLPDWYGRTAAQESFGHRLANQGHAALCLDVYGGGRSAENAADAESLMTPLVEDRNGLAQQLVELINASKSATGQHRFSVIGFCFGGLCALDLARTGQEFDLVASFHGLLDPNPSLTGRPIPSRVAVFHGWRDPFAAPSSLMSLASELDLAGADWQLHCYGKAMHAFMMEHADTPESGIAYDRPAARTSWEILLSLLSKGE
jgi:dienelactone hydrolase